VIWAAAGTPFAVFALKPADLQSMTGGDGWIWRRTETGQGHDRLLN